MLDALPTSYAPPIHASLLFYMGNATREDTLPYLRSYFVPVREWSREFADVAALHSAVPRHGDLPQQVEAAVLDGKRPEAMQSVWDALQQGYTPEQVAQSLVLAAARRLLRFDLQVDSDPTVQEGWLSATHRLTFASAARLAQLRFDSPAALHFLFQAAAFIHSGAPMDAATVRFDDVALAESEPFSAPLSQLRERILARDAAAALRQVLGNLGATSLDPTQHHELIQVLHRCALDANLVRPIFRVHAIKTLLAGIEETVALGSHARGALPLLAAVRFLASPVHEVRSTAAAHAATEWINHGRMIRKLTQ
jgi:hypothetical protein